MARKLGTSRNDVLTGTASADVLLGAAGNDTLKGLNGNDRLDGGLGRDLMVGGKGNDTYMVDNLGDRPKELFNQGIDKVFSKVGFVLPANVENLTLTGSAHIKGVGNGLANIIVGNNGNNRLDGLAGRDQLFGGRGNDTLVYDARDATAQGGVGTDTLVLTGAGQKLSLHTATTVYSGIEIIDLGSAGQQSLVLDSAGLKVFTSQQALRVDGTALDLVSFSGGTWLASQVQQINGQSYARYAKDGAVALVDTDIGIGAENVDVSGLAGAFGLVLRGAAAGDAAGASVAGGHDWNGDGFDDLVIGAPEADPNGAGAGSAYVLFGGAALGDIDLAALDSATSGLVLNGGHAGDHIGLSVGMGADSNSDGFAEAVVGSAGPGSVASIPAHLYVAFGQGSEAPDASTLNPPSGGVVVVARQPSSFSASIGDFAVSVASAGDVNGDGREDMLAGFELLRAQNAPTTAGVWTVFLGADNRALSGTTYLPTDASHAGAAVAAAGDLNGDGFGDVLVGAPRADVGGAVDAGRVDVLLGGATGLGADATFHLNGAAAADLAGSAVAGAGDLNGDGLADLLVGAPGANAAYLVFGQAAAFASDVDLGALGGANGFRIVGAAPGDLLGAAVAAAGDVNGDGFDDLLVGAPQANGGAGAAYLLFGHEGGFAASIALASLRADQGVVFAGAGAGAHLGQALSAAGDVNGDGFDDFVIGAPAGDAIGKVDAGLGYLVFGRAFTGLAPTITGEGDDTLNGTAAHDVLIGGRGNDFFDGGAGSDTLRGGAGDDVFLFDAGDRVDGGSGLDTLRITGTDQNMDLRGIGDTRFENIEAIDLNGSGNNLLQLGLGDLLALSGDENFLRVSGEAGDAVETFGVTWTAAGSTVIDGVTYDDWSFGAVHLLVDTDLAFTSNVPV